MTQPKYAMCGICGDVVYAGPSLHTIPRMCKCSATAVLTTEDRGYVRWDTKRYVENAKEVGQKAYDAVYLKAKLDAYETAKAAGLTEDETVASIASATSKVRSMAEEARLVASHAAPTGPEVEYTEEVLDPGITRRHVGETTLSSIFKDVAAKAERLREGEEL